MSVDEDGEAVVQLAPGDWTVAVSAPRYGMQERAVVIAHDATGRPFDARVVAAYD